MLIICILQLSPMLLVALGTAGAWGLVDDSKPDLSMFKLRRVDTRQLARSRLGKPITDLATGAVHMHESLFVEANNVKCPAYAHLFKLIKGQEGKGKSPDGLNVIRQNFVETLAILITYDRIIYHELFLRAATRVSADHFIEAIKLLEEEEGPAFDSIQAAGRQAAWFDLIQCLSSYMVGRLGSPKVHQLLRNSSRQKRSAELAKFRSIPVDVAPPSAPAEGDNAPEGLVRNLANKYEDQRGRMLSALETRKANEQLEALEDDATRELKRQIVAEQRDGSGDEANGAAADGGNNAEDDDAPEVGNDKQEMDVGPDVAEVVELIVPIGGDEQKGGRDEKEHQREAVVSEQVDAATSDALDMDSTRFRESQLAILKFIRMRLEQRPTARFERAPRLSMQLAFDFSSHWDDLLAAKLDTSTPLGKHAAIILQDPQNVALAQKVGLAIKTYLELTRVLDDMRLHEDQYESMDDLRLPFERLTELLNSMDGSFDVDDLRRLHSIWLTKFTEYSTIDGFINSDSW